MSIHIPTTLREWTLLNGKVEHYFYVPTTARMEKIVWFVTISGPTAGLLYLLSAWKRWRTNGSWLDRVDEEGYFYPHTHVVIPIWAFAFTCVNLAHSISLLIDTGSRLHTRTVGFNLTTYPMLTCFGWTKIWALLYAMPPSKYRLAQVNHKIGCPTPQSMSRYFSVTLFNLFIITGYLGCFCGGLPSITLAIKEAVHLNFLREKYESLYGSLIQTFLKNRPQIALHLRTLLTLKEMAHTKDDLRKNFDTMFIIFLAVTLLQVMLLLWNSYRILAALYYQVMILKDAGKRLKQGHLGYPARNEFGWSNVSSEVDSSLKIATVPRSEFASSRTTIPANIITAEDRAPNFRFSWRHYLPTFKRGTGVSAALWKSGPFKKTQAQILDGGTNQMMFYYHQLRRYAMNTLWQTIITAAVMLSYIVLISMLIGPKFLSLSVMELEVTVFVWINITWNCGTGLLLGIVSLPNFLGIMISMCLIDMKFVASLVPDFLYRRFFTCSGSDFRMIFPTLQNLDACLSFEEMSFFHSMCARTLLE